LSFKDMRSFLDYLDERGEFATVDQMVDTEFEIAAFIRRASDNDGPAFLFSNVKGYDLRVAGGLFCTPSRPPIIGRPWSASPTGSRIRSIPCRSRGAPARRSCSQGNRST